MGWTAAELPDLRDRTALVTGGNSGLGLETARALAARGASVLIACRGQAKAQQAIADIRGGLPEARLAFLPLDLSDLASVRRCAEQFAATQARLDILCNNAGVMATPEGRTRDGFETQFGTNHLGHFALTGLLMPQLRATPGARVVVVSSLAHRSGPHRLHDPNWERSRYSPAAAYGWSKLANLMFALELDRRLRKAGIEAKAVAAHPGYTATNIGFGDFTAPTSLKGRVMQLGNRLLAQSAARGALPTLYAATATDVQGGEYIGPDGPLEFRGHPVRVRPNRHAADLDAAARLWALSEQLTGLRYP